MLTLKIINQHIKENILGRQKSLSNENPDFIAFFLNLEAFFLHSDFSDTLKDLSAAADFKAFMENLKKIFDEAAKESANEERDFRDYFSNKLMAEIESWCFYYAVRGFTWAYEGLLDPINVELTERFDDLVGYFSAKLPDEPPCAPELLFALVNDITRDGKGKETSDEETDALIKAILVSEAGFSCNVNPANIATSPTKIPLPSVISALFFMHELGWIKLSEALIQELARAKDPNLLRNFEVFCKAVNIYSRTPSLIAKFTCYESTLNRINRARDGIIKKVLKSSFERANERLGLSDPASMAFAHDHILLRMHFLVSNGPFSIEQWNITADPFFENHPRMLAVAIAIVLVCFQNKKINNLTLADIQKIQRNISDLQNQALPEELKYFFIFNQAIFLWHGFGSERADRDRAADLFKKITTREHLWQPLRTIAERLLLERAGLKSIARKARLLALTGLPLQRTELPFARESTPSPDADSPSKRVAAFRR